MLAEKRACEDETPAEAPLKILEIAPFIAPIDERHPHLGGAQAILADIARGLAARGHDVALAAASGSRVEGVRVVDLGIDARTLRPAALLAEDRDPGDEAAQRAAFASTREWLDSHPVDIAHAHAYDAPAFDALVGARPRMVHTLHLPPIDRGVVAAARRATDARFTTVSRANAGAWRAAGVDVDVVVPNGIDAAAIPFGDGSGGFLICAGRVSPEKGTDLAVAIAAAAGIPLLIVGGVYDRDFYERAVRPHVRERTEWRPGDPVAGVLYAGPRPRAELHRIFGGARATLMPVRWEEPFGIVALESLAAGTPVVAAARGGLPEVLDDSTGALVSGEEVGAFVTATRRALRADRATCRERAKEFTLDAMLDGYEEVLSGEPRGV